MKCLSRSYFGGLLDGPATPGEAGIYGLLMVAKVSLGHVCS
jgi:hypothetical protein